MAPEKKKLRVATASLAGCFGCHMSLLDLDERILELLKHIEFDRSPITDIKTCGPCITSLCHRSLGRCGSNSNSLAAWCSSGARGDERWSRLRSFITR